MPTSKKGPEQTIGGRIAQARFTLAARLGRNVTQAWLADQAGVSGPTVSQWESGVTEPTVSSIAKIAKALQTDPAWIAWGIVTESATPTLDRLQKDKEHTVSDVLRELQKPAAKRRNGGKAG